MPIKKQNIKDLKSSVMRGPTKEQQDKVVQYYEDRKIGNYLSAAKLIYQLQSRYKTVVQKALQQVLQYEDAQPVTGRLEREREMKTYTRLTSKTTDADAKQKYEDKIKLNVPLKGKFTKEEADEYRAQAGKIKRLNEAEQKQIPKTGTKEKAISKDHSKSLQKI